MLDKSTLPEMLRPLMFAPSYKANRCYICGKPANNQHHMVRRNAGELYVAGIKREKPTITLCGNGTTGCHGLAHQNRLHFRFKHDLQLDPNKLLSGSANISGRLEYLLVDKPIKYQDALNSDGWKPVRLPKECS